MRVFAAGFFSAIAYTPLIDQPPPSFLDAFWHRKNRNGNNAAATFSFSQPSSRMKPPLV